MPQMQLIPRICHLHRAPTVGRPARAEDHAEFVVSKTKMECLSPNFGTKNFYSVHFDCTKEETIFNNQKERWPETYSPAWCFTY